jgi:transportin-3
MTLGRYTEWTAHHPETLQQQLDFIMQAFSHPSKEVVRGATLAFRFFCVDCADLLKPFFGQLHQFYVSVVSSLPDGAQVDVTEGIAAIVAKQPQEQLYENLKICSAPILDNIMQLASNATNDKTKLAIAGKKSRLDYDMR